MLCDVTAVKVISMFGYFKASEDGILRHHYHQRVFFFFFFFNIFHKVCFNPVTNGSCSVNIVWSLFGIRAKIAAFQITQVISMRVLERGLLTLDQLYYHFFYSICKVQWNKEKLQTVHYNIRALPKIKTSYQSWRNLTIRSCFWSSIP